VFSFPFLTLVQYFLAQFKGRLIPERNPGKLKCIGSGQHDPGILAIESIFIRQFLVLLFHRFTLVRSLWKIHPYQLYLLFMKNPEKRRVFQNSTFQLPAIGAPIRSFKHKQLKPVANLFLLKTGGQRQKNQRKNKGKQNRFQ